MNKLYFFIPRKTLFLIILLLGVIAILGLILFARQSKKNTLPPATIISQSPTKLSPLQKTIIGTTKTEDVSKNYQINNIQSLPNGDLEYSIYSKVETRPDLIVFQNNLAKFERMVIVGNTSLGTMRLSDQILKLGPAEKTIKGSKFYGYHMETYIYATKGTAFVANTNADEVYEVQIFTPTSLENYLNSYGTDIKEYPEIIERN